MSFVIKFRPGLFVVMAAVIWPCNGMAHVENADLLDFGNDNQWRRHVGGISSQSDTMLFFKTRGPENVSSRSLTADSVGCFGSIAGFERPVSLWRRISNWVASRIGANGDLRSTRIFGGERDRGLTADSFNGVYVIAIGEGRDASGSLAVNWSGSNSEDDALTDWPGLFDFKLDTGAFEHVVFLGHRSGLVAGASVNRTALEAELAAHFNEVVSNVR